MAALVSYFN